MMQDDIIYEDAKLEMIKELEKRHLMILATSEEKVVTARLMRCVLKDLTIYCATDRRSRKYKQIMANPNVALSEGGLQIEGVAYMQGHPLEEDNAPYIEVFQKKQPDVYEIWSQTYFQNPDFRLIKIIPRRIALYKSGRLDNVSEHHMVILNTVKEEAYRIGDYETPAYNE